MSDITQNDYVSITSGVIGGNAIAAPQLIGLVISTSALLDPAKVLSFQSALAVGNYFGTSSEEYNRAVKYFNYVSPSIRQPQNLTFARWCSTAAPASIYGNEGNYTLAALNLVTAGTITFNFNGTNVVVSAINLSSAANLAAVATALQTAFRANADAHLTTCTVTYDAINGRFDFVASNTSVTTGTFSIPQTGSANTDLANALGWYASQGALVLSSSVSNQPVDAFNNAVGINNNFGTFCYTTAANLTLLQAEAVAAANAANYNNLYMPCFAVTPENYATWAAGMATDAGVALVYQLDSLNEYPEMIPMSIAAATDYTQRNGVQNYMYRQMPNTTPSVTDSTTKATLDGLRINYYGVTQVNGQQVAFFQNGALCGTATSPSAMNVYVNESWLKRSLAADLLSLQLSLPILSADAEGVAQIRLTLENRIDSALKNGVISEGKTLTSLQQIDITTLSGDDNAWRDVQNNGYWLDIEIQPFTDPNSSINAYQAVYTLIYSKDDAVQKIIGTHAMV